MAMFSRADLGIHHPRYDSVRSQGCAVDPEYEAALASGEIVHYDDEKAKVRYSYAGGADMWIDGYPGDTYYTIEARLGRSMNTAKLTKKYLNAQMLHHGLIKPGQKNALSKEECCEKVMGHFYAGYLVTIEKETMEIYRRLKEEYKEKFGEKETVRMAYSVGELRDMFKKQKEEEAKKDVAAARKVDHEPHDEGADGATDKEGNATAIRDAVADPVNKDVADETKGGIDVEGGKERDGGVKKTAGKGRKRGTQADAPRRSNRLKGLNA